MTSSKNHWENIFTDETDSQKNWFEDYPHTSMKFIADAGLAKNAAIIDVGGGDSKLVDALLNGGYTMLPCLIFQRKRLRMQKNVLANVVKLLDGL